jgi:hypothetical protein
MHPSTSHAVLPGLCPNSLRPSVQRKLRLRERSAEIQVENDFQPGFWSFNLDIRISNLDFGAFNPDCGAFNLDFRTSHLDCGLPTGIAPHSTGIALR